MTSWHHFQDSLSFCIWTWKWCHDVTETLFFLIANFYLLMKFRSSRNFFSGFLFAAATAGMTFTYSLFLPQFKGMNFHIFTFIRISSWCHKKRANPEITHQYWMVFVFFLRRWVFDFCPVECLQYPFWLISPTVHMRVSNTSWLVERGKKHVADILNSNCRNANMPVAVRWYWSAVSLAITCISKMSLN